MYALKVNQYICELLAIQKYKWCIYVYMCMYVFIYMDVCIYIYIVIEIDIFSIHKTSGRRICILGI